MITITKKITVQDENGTRENEILLKKMDDKMFEHYKQNPLGMAPSVREHFRIPENRTFMVSMDNGTEGCVWIGPIPKTKS